MAVAIEIEYDIIYNNKLKWLPTKYGLYFYKISYKDENIKLYEFNILNFKRISVDKINKSDEILYMLQDKIKELDSSKENTLKKKKEYSYVEEELSNWKK